MSVKIEYEASVFQNFQQMFLYTENVSVQNDKFTKG